MRKEEFELAKKKAKNKANSASSAAPATVDEYIASCPREVQRLLKQIRSTVRRAAPEAEERISYRMPAFFQSGVLLYYAAFKKHIGLYPPIRGDAALEKAVARYAGPQGNLQLPLDEPLPLKLIERIVKLRLKQNLAEAK